MRTSAMEAVDGGGAIQSAVAEALSHPEEIKATVNLSVGDRMKLKAAARTRAAGLVAAALMVSSILVVVAFVVRDGGGLGHWRYL